MAIYEPVTKKFLCECGCGEECQFYSNYKRGHYMRTKEGKEKLGKRLSETLSDRVQSSEIIEKIRRSVQAFWDSKEGSKAKQKMSERETGLTWDSEAKGNMSKAQQKSYREDPTIGDRISETNTGRIQSPRAIGNMSRAKQGFYASKEGEEAVRKISEALTGRFLSEERKQHISRGGLQARQDDPTIVSRISEANCGQVRSREFCEKMRSIRQEFLDSEGGEKWKESLSGENSPNWKGGYNGGRNGPYWEATREFIILRDDFTCQGCGRKGKSCSDFDVHHIDGDTSSMGDRNLITTCHLCNVRASNKYEEEYWFGFYTNKIKEIYNNSTGVKDDKN